MKDFAIWRPAVRDRLARVSARIGTVLARAVMGDGGYRGVEYRPFPDIDRRNRFQERLEIPSMAFALRLGTGVRLLEIGCGRGIGLLTLGRVLEPRIAAGVDIDRRLLAAARRLLDDAGMRAELVRGDARSLPFPNQWFDLVVDFGTCYHVAHPTRVLDEIDRVLRPGGRFVHETRLSQLLSHPLRAWDRALPLRDAPDLRLERWRLLWSVRKKGGD